ncbi:MAG: carbon storage regulator [Candidatus Peribacter riflensis]|uniref:Translational regulator CsrA n=1 Tax=Candidatus Peribacter riflensis TaxID=1735162 RepID=A0A0S1STH3_9BACT|nr:MAG: carbon storage regulator [Candidatus Peribacter riflensis]ALM11579.1 MAG: Carbon storage regulator like protein [Candidatus Peribacter riflensis]ALM12681.1 MAG: carbon storage regulator [Candidatus Peribacter riflensis]ALM13782.1 MAG: carbon storage regulator [Candidatus Peribacter riflensis]ALM14885.1 MAG: carbon storage regulator [Candidatus Peribacter riflensis]
MLVLTRSLHQVILIGGTIEVAADRIGSRVVRFSVRASGYPIARGECPAAGSASKDGVLILARKRGERILIGGDIVVTLLRIVGNRVKVGITAPSEVVILRDELVV